MKPLDFFLGIVVLPIALLVVALLTVTGGWWLYERLLFRKAPLTLPG